MHKNNEEDRARAADIFLLGLCRRLQLGRQSFVEAVKFSDSSYDHFSEPNFSEVKSVK